MRGDDQVTGKREIFGTDGGRGLANAGAMTPDNILRLGMAVPGGILEPLPSFVNILRSA